MKIIELLQSRKFWAAVLGLLFIVLKDYYGIEPTIKEEELLNLVMKNVSIALIIAAYIIGIGLENTTKKQ